MGDRNTLDERNSFELVLRDDRLCFCLWAILVTDAVRLLSFPLLITAGERLYTYDGLPFKGPVTCVEYHPFDQVVAMCGLGGRTVSVLLYKYRDPSDPETPIDESPAGSMEQHNQQQASNQGAPIHIQVSMGSTERSKDHVMNPFPRPLMPPAILSKVPLGLTPAQRRWKLQKSMTLDSGSQNVLRTVTNNRGSPSHRALLQKTAPSSPRLTQRGQQNFFRPQLSTSIEHSVVHGIGSNQTASSHQSPSPSRHTPTNVNSDHSPSHASPQSRMKRAMKKLEIALKMKSLDASSSSRVKEPWEVLLLFWTLAFSDSVDEPPETDALNALCSIFKGECWSQPQVSPAILIRQELSRALRCFEKKYESSQDHCCKNEECFSVKWLQGLLCLRKL